MLYSEATQSMAFVCRLWLHCPERKPSKAKIWPDNCRTILLLMPGNMFESIYLHTSKIVFVLPFLSLCLRAPQASSVADQKPRMQRTSECELSLAMCSLTYDGHSLCSLSLPLSTKSRVTTSMQAVACHVMYHLIGFMCFFNTKKKR